MATGEGIALRLRSFAARRWAWTDPDAPLTAEQRRRARTATVFAFLYLAGALAASLTLVVPAHDRDTGAMSALLTVVLGCGVVALAVFDRLPPWTWHALTVGGPVLICWAATVAGDLAPVMLLFLAWQPLYSAYLFSFRQTVLYTAVSAASFGVYASSVLGPVGLLSGLVALPVLLGPAFVVVFLVRQERVTARALRQAQEQRAREERLETVGRLAGGVAHDFNNLLTVMTGHAQLALGRCEDPAIRADLTEIAGAVDRAAALTRQLLVFTRTSSAPTAPLVDVAQVVKRTATLMRRILPADVEIALTGADESLWARLDDAELDRVLVNLCLNARDAMPGGGLLDVRVGRAVTHGEAVAVVTVTDSGVGMDEDTQERAFEPFFTTKGERGSGLGLASVERVVREQGGDLLLESAPGGGTTVTLFLPLAPGPPGEGRAVPVALPVARRHEIVLLVEDEHSVRQVTAEGLRRLGYTVLEAGDGNEALGTMGGSPVDVVISDVVMPGLGGHELADAVESQFPGTPVLFLSGHAESHVVRARVDLGSANLLLKPYSLDALAKALRGVLDGVGTPHSLSAVPPPPPPRS